MATTTDPVPVGRPAPPFQLPTIDGGSVSLDQLDAIALCVAFVCNHCPYVKHVEDALGRLLAGQDPDEVAVVAICSNDATTHPDDAPDGLRQQAERAGWDFPYAVDADSSVARAYGAVCTPDFFVHDVRRRLVYRGPMDASTPGNDQPNDAALLREALRRAVAGEPVPAPHPAPMGCSIKWAEER